MIKLDIKYRCVRVSGLPLTFCISKLSFKEQSPPLAVITNYLLRPN